MVVDPLRDLPVPMKRDRLNIIPTKLWNRRRMFPKGRNVEHPGLAERSTTGC